MKCCVGYLFTQRIIKTKITEKKYFVYGIPGGFSKLCATSKEAQEEYQKLKTHDNCIIHDGEIISKMGIDYKHAWLGQYVIYQMNY